MDRLLVASEYTDPFFHWKDVVYKLHQESINKDYKVGLLLISKKIGTAYCWNILDVAKKLEIPTIIHSTNTGLGGSILEPRISADWCKELQDAIDTWVEAYPEAKFVLRIDPIIPHHSSEAIICSMMQYAKFSGVNDVRFSIMDNYPFVRNRFEKYNLSTPNTFQYSRLEVSIWSQKITEWAEVLEMTANSCAEDANFSCGTQGCASKEEWSALGLDLEPYTFKSREFCTCTAKKYDLLKRLPCENNCMYCYYSKNR